MNQQGHTPGDGGEVAQVTPKELGIHCADSISPDLFAPLVKRVADDIYERLLDTVQDYLVENSEWNIAERIEAAERQAAHDRQERLAAVNNHEALVEALRKLAGNAGALAAFEHEIREAAGNTNWQCLKEAISAADALLSRINGEGE